MTVSEINTEKGNHTKDNQDVISISKNGNTHLYAIMDGISGKAKSGSFARKMGELLKDKISKSTRRQLSPKFIRIHILTILEDSREEIKFDYCAAGMSIAIIVVIEKKVALLMHVGDCGIGLLQPDGQVKWITVPHTLLGIPIPNLINKPYRYILKRAFRAKEKAELDWVVRPFNGRDCYVLATDGWWDTTNRLLKSSCSSKDDASMIKIQKSKSR